MTEPARFASPTGEAFPPPRVRLPLAFDAVALAAEARAQDAAHWSVHFNADYHNGGWSGVTLRGTDDDPAQLFVRPDGAARDTALLARCPAAAAALARFACPIRGARFLRLAPGGEIAEHSDPDLRFADGHARLHIVLATEPAVEFYVDGERVVMEEGECWFLDLARPHRVTHRGARDRLHLVVDVVVDDWLRAQITAGDCPRRTPAVPGGADEFARFAARVADDDALAARLQAITSDAEFVAATLGEGRVAGFAFAVTDVRAAMAAGRRRWITQWLV